MKHNFASTLWAKAQKKAKLFPIIVPPIAQFKN